MVGRADQNRHERNSRYVLFASLGDWRRMVASRRFDPFAAPFGNGRFLAHSGRSGKLQSPSGPSPYRTSATAIGSDRLEWGFFLDVRGGDVRDDPSSATCTPSPRSHRYALGRRSPLGWSQTAREGASPVLSRLKATKMTPDQIAGAERLARERKPTTPSP